MRTIFLGLLISGTFLGVAMSLGSPVGKSQTPQSYPLVCRGKPNADISSSRGRLMMKFIRGTTPADQGLAHGECSWMDRGMYPTEPNVLVQTVPEGVGGRPEFQWASELREADTYWTFDV